MRPRRFATGTAELEQACADVKRAYRNLSFDPPGPDNRRPALDGFAKALIFLLIAWACWSGLGWGRQWLLDHALTSSYMTFAETLAAQRAVVPHPQWQVGDSNEVTLEDGQKIRVTFMGEIPRGTRISSTDIAIGQMWKYGAGYWVWAVPRGGGQATWIDP